MCNFCMASKYFTFLTDCMALTDHLFLKLFPVSGCYRRESAEGLCTYGGYDCACVSSSTGGRNGEWGMQREEEDPAYLWRALQRACAVCACTTASTQHWRFCHLLLLFDLLQPNRHPRSSNSVLSAWCLLQSGPDLCPGFLVLVIMLLV